VVDKIEQRLGSLGLKDEYEGGEMSGNYLRTIITTGNDARQFGSGQSIAEERYDPPPPLDLAFVASMVREEMQTFYTGQPGGAYSRATGGLIYDTTIGLAGYCAATARFRIFKFTPTEERGADGFVKEVPKVIMTEVADDEVLLLGSSPSDHERILKAIETATPAMPESYSEDERRSLAIQDVIEREINAAKIRGVGGPIQRAEVSSEYGFRWVADPWQPEEELDW
jgi:hypothetical protein